MVLKTAKDKNLLSNGKIILCCRETPLNIFDKVDSIEYPRDITAKA